jgi:hypothetical protein
VRPVAQLVWQFVRWYGLLMLGIVAAVLTVIRIDGGAKPKDLFVWLFVATLAIGGRVTSIAASHAWRLLPNGHRVLTSALAAFSLATSLYLGGLAAWAGLRSIVDDPLANIAVVFVAVSGLCFLNFTRELHGWRSLLLTLGILGVTGLALTAMSYGPAAWSWIATAVYVVFWALALRTTGVPRSAVEPRSKITVGDGTPSRIERLQTRVLLLRSPAHSLLQADRSLFLRVSGGLLLISGWAVANHLAIGSLIPVDSYAVVMSLMACGLSVVAFAQSLGTAGRARILWLRCADSRAALFRMCEKALLSNVAALSVVAWLLVTSFALLRGNDIGVAEALTALVGCVAGTLAPIWFALILPTLTRARLRIPTAVLAAVAIAIAPVLWVKKLLEVATGGWESADMPTLVVLVACCVALRVIAVWRWSSIDWALLRPLARDHELRRIA